MTDTDTRTRVPLTKPVDLAQLAAEVGAALSASEDDLVVADADAPVTPEALSAALDAHTPDPDFGRPDEDRQLRAIRTKAREVAAGNGTFTAAQVQKILAHLILRSTR